MNVAALRLLKNRCDVNITEKLLESNNNTRYFFFQLKLEVENENRRLLFKRGELHRNFAKPFTEGLFLKVA